ncbi:hypothetical protein JCM11641_004100 [Rhodosporidiobolus odoratus]
MSTSSSPPSPSTTTPSEASLPSEPAQKPTILDAARTISPITDLQRLPEIPCSRNSLLFGIVAGAAVGGLRFVFSRTARRGRLYGGESGWSEIGSAANWAVGAWGVGSLGAWETCRARQTAEAARMHALVTEIKQKRAAKLARQADRERERTAEKPIGGILIGDKGREILREREEKRLEGSAGDEAEKKGGGWFSGRV